MLILLVTLATITAGDGICPPGNTARAHTSCCTMLCNNKGRLSVRKSFQSTLWSCPALASTFLLPTAKCVVLGKVTTLLQCATGKSRAAIEELQVIVYYPSVHCPPSANVIPSVRPAEDVPRKRSGACRARYIANGIMPFKCIPQVRIRACDSNRSPTPLS